MITSTVLNTFEPDLETRIKTAPSGVGVKVILEQNRTDGWHVIAYSAFRMLDEHQKEYTTSGEVLFVVAFDGK